MSENAVLIDFIIVAIRIKRQSLCLSVALLKLFAVKNQENRAGVLMTSIKFSFTSSL